MATFLPGNGVLDPLGMALGQGLGSGINSALENRDRQRLLDALSAYQTQSGIASSLGVQNIPPLQLPNFLSPQYRGLGQQIDAMALQSLMPLSPEQQAEIANTQAQTGLYGAQTDAIRNPPQQQLSALDLVRIQEIQRGMDKPFYQPGIIENTETGEQNPYQWGNNIPDGWKVVRTPESVTNVNLGTASASERTSLAEGASTIDSLNNLKSLFDSVSTGSGVNAYPGPVQGPVSSALGAFGNSPQKREEFRAATLAFKNAMIKAITGAQMSESEARRIMGQIPDTNDPPTRWMAKWNQSLNNIQQIQNRRVEVLQKSGIEAPELSSSPSTQEPSTPSQTRPPATQTIPITAVNPQTGERIQSTDGGVTWQAIK